MAKYYFILILVMGGVLYYVFLEDPCNTVLKADFSSQYPDYKILETGAREGSPDEVQCHVYYEKPGSEQVHEETWVYQKSESGWSFSKVLGATKAEQAP